MPVLAGQNLPGTSIAGAGVRRPPRRAGRRFTRILLAGAVALPLTVGCLSRGDAQEGTKPLSVWTYSLYKTLTYEFFANLADLGLYYTVLGGTGAGGLLFGAVNVVTAAATYFTYELAWNLYGPPIRDLPPAEAAEVAIDKTLLYRVASTARNLVLGYAFTGSIATTVTYAVVSNVVDAVIYLANEYGWYTHGPPVAANGSPSEQVSGFGVSGAFEDAYRVSAIALGAVGGVIVANIATGGLASSVLVIGTPAAQTGAAYLAGLATTTIGAVGGAFAADWLVGQ